MERVRTTDYIVVSLKGRSQGGGIPDDTANKALRKCYLQPGTPGKDLHEHAVPMEVHKDKIKLKTWREGGAGLRGKLVLETSPTEEHRLDHGIVTNNVSMSESSTHRIITLQGQYLFEAVIECKPVPDTSLPTAIPVVLAPSKSHEPLNSIVGKNPEDATLSEILRETSMPATTTTGLARAEVAEETESAPTSPVHTVSAPPTPPNAPMGPKPAASAVASAPRNAESTHKRATRKTTRMKKDGNQKALIDWALQQIATGLGITIEGMQNPSERNGPEADGRKLSVHLLKDLIGIRPVSQLTPIFTPNAQNTGALYAIANGGKALAKKSKYKNLLEDIVEKSKAFADSNTVPTAAPAAPTPRNPKTAATGASHNSAQDASICTLFETGRTADVIAAAFGISVDEVYTSLGRLSATDRPLVQKIRAAVGQTSL